MPGARGRLTGQARPVRGHTERRGDSAMLGITPQGFDIQTVSTVQPSNGARVVGFDGGLVARLPPDHADRDRILFDAQDSLRRRRPVGVVLDSSGGILELTHAHETGVDSVQEDDEDKTRLAVWCWEFSPVCYLTRDHPESNRIRETLEQAASGGRVWLANHARRVESETEV